MKKLSVVMIVSLLLAMLSACATPTPEMVETTVEVLVEKTVEVEVVKTVEVEVEKTVVVVATPEPGAVEEVRFLVQEIDPPSVEAYLKMQKPFEEQNPYDIVMEFTDPEGVMQKIPAVMAAGGVLDVIQPDPGMAITMAKNGDLLPLDEVVEALGGEDQFLVNTLLKFDGVTYCIPYATAGPVLWYRKDLFEEAGLEPPTTWDDWLETAEALTMDTTGDGENDIYGIAAPGAEAMMTSIMSQVFLWHTGHEIFDEELNIYYDDPKTAEMLEFYADLLQYAPPGASAYEFFDVVDAFTSGKTAMGIYWGRILGRVYSDTPELIGKVGAVPLPYKEMKGTYADVSYNCSFAGTAHPEAAKAWLQFMSEPEQAIKFSLTVPGHLGPVTYAQYDALLEADSPLKENPDIAATLFGISEYYYDPSKNAGGLNFETKTFENTGVINPYISPLWASNVLATAVQRVAYGGEDAATVVAEIQAEIERVVAEAKELE
ncbi:MAG: sugar ABC transporter substrate-binding protein [Anaerolineales bacterium]